MGSLFLTVDFAFFILVLMLAFESYQMALPSAIELKVSRTL